MPIVKLYSSGENIRFTVNQIIIFLAVDNDATCHKFV